jgi:hypothetical protein
MELDAIPGTPISQIVFSDDEDYFGIVPDKPATPLHNYNVEISSDEEEETDTSSTKKLTISNKVCGREKEEDQGEDEDIAVHNSANISGVGHEMSIKKTAQEDTQVHSMGEAYMSHADVQVTSLIYRKDWKQTLLW